jgi:iron-sulfur cluster repair protein YtfE (RIC family)
MTDERPTAAFRAEHRVMQEHLGHVHERVGAMPTQQPADQRKMAQKVASFFEKHIKPHAEWEERFLYPVVNKLAGGRPRAFTSTMRYEHRIVGRWIGVIISLRTQLYEPAARSVDRRVAQRAKPAA